MSPFVSPKTLSRVMEDFDTETPQIRFPVGFVTRCVFTYSFLLFFGFFTFYHLLSFISFILVILAGIYAVMIGRLFSLLGLSRWKYIVGNILWWALIAPLGILVRMAIFSMLSPLL